MQVAYVFGPNDLRMAEIPAPSAGPRDVVLRIATVGICGSDLALIAKGGPLVRAAEPFPLGHELSGTVVERGAEVSSVAIGDRVVLNPLINSVGIGSTEGGFGELLLVRDVVTNPGSLLPLPASVSFDAGALVEPLAVSVHGVNQLGAGPGDKVAVYGAGPIGLAAVVALRHRGVEDIAVFELSELRRNRAKALGATKVVDPRLTPPAEALKALHGSVPSQWGELPATTHYLEASGAPIIPDIIGYAAPGARLCVISHQKKLVPVDFTLFHMKELQFVGALGYPRELSDVLDMLAQNEIDPEQMITHRFHFDNILEAFDTAHQSDHAAKVLVQFGG